jgi:hypothetical protein
VSIQKGSVLQESPIRNIVPVVGSDRIGSCMPSYIIKVMEKSTGFFPTGIFQLSSVGLINGFSIIVVPFCYESTRHY